MVSMLDCIQRVPERMKWIVEHFSELFAPLEKAFTGLTWDEIVLVGCDALYLPVV